MHILTTLSAQPRRGVDAYREGSHSCSCESFHFNASLRGALCLGGDVHSVLLSIQAQLHVYLQQQWCSAPTQCVSVKL